MPDTVLLLGNYRPTLSVARQLGAAGHRLIVTRGGGPEGCSEYSRHVDKCWDHPPVDDLEAFFAALADFLAERPDIKIVYPIWEKFVKGLALYQDLLPDDRIYATPPAQTVLNCLDKTKMMSIAAEAGVPVAPFAIARGYQELVREGSHIEFPAVLRPASSALPILGKKVLIAESLDELRRVLPSWPQEHDELILQSRVSGRRHNLYFAARDGQPIRYLAAEIIRSHKADGTGLAVDGQTIELEPDLRTYADSVLRALNYTGVGCLQFQVNRATDQMTFLELNPRIGGNHAITEACGLNLSRLAIDLACGRAQHESLNIGPPGRRYSWTYGDLRGLISGLAKRDVGTRQAAAWIWQMIVTSLRTSTRMTWSWSDPLPTIMLFLGLLNPSQPSAGPAPKAADATKRDGSAPLATTLKEA